MEKAAYSSLLPFHPLPSSYLQGEGRGHRWWLLQAQGSQKSRLLVHGSRDRGIKKASLSQNMPAAYLPTVITFQDTILNHYSPFQFQLEFLRSFSTTQPMSFSTHSSQESLSTSFIYFYFKYCLKGCIIFKSYFLHKCILNMYFQLSNSQSLQIWILRKTYCNHMPLVTSLIFSKGTVQIHNS